MAPAFTLIEMLVVIGIITILLTIGSMGLKNMSKASGVGAGIPVAEALFAEARSLAMSKGTKSRVLIHAQEDHTNEYHRERYLRYMAIEYFVLDPIDQNPNDPNATGDWVIASKGVKLPKGVYFMKELSESGGVDLLTEPDVSLPGGPTASATCYYYEFNAEGMIVTTSAGGTPPPTSNNDVSRFVIASGSLPPGATEPTVSGQNMGGFVIWRTGRTSVFRHPDQIEGN